MLLLVLIDYAPMESDSLHSHPRTVSDDCTHGRDEGFASNLDDRRLSAGGGVEANDLLVPAAAFPGGQVVVSSVDSHVPVLDSFSHFFKECRT